MNIVASEFALSSFIAAFEAGTFPVAEFHHSEHLAVAACYLLAHTDREAARRARSGIRGYNLAQGGRNTDEAGYHETLTVFWLALVRANLCTTISRLEAVRCILDSFAPFRDIVRDFYSFDVVKSREARLSWVCPDLPDPAVSFVLPVWKSIQM